MTDDQIAAFVKAFLEHDVPHWNERDRFIFQGWQSRQPEIAAKDKTIDDLALQKGILKAEVGRLGSENDALKGELIKLSGYRDKYLAALEEIAELRGIE